MRVIFLDIDGVLNSVRAFRRAKKGLIPRQNKGRGIIDPLHVKHLNSIVEKTGAVVVISSTWRLENGARERILRYLKKCGFKGKIHQDGTTCRLPGDYGRGREILIWLFGHGIEVESFVILDDDGDMDPLSLNLVQTDGFKGLQKKHVAPAVRILKRSYGQPFRPWSELQASSKKTKIRRMPAPAKG